MKNLINCKQLLNAAISSCQKNISIDDAIPSIAKIMNSTPKDIISILQKSNVIDGGLFPDWNENFKLNKAHNIAQQKKCMKPSKSLSRKGERWTSEEEQKLREAAHKYMRTKSSLEEFAKGVEYEFGRSKSALLDRARKLGLIIWKNGYDQWAIKIAHPKSNITISTINVDCFATFDFDEFITKLDNPILAPMLSELLSRYRKDTTQLSEGFFMPMPIPTGIGKTYNTMTLLLVYILLRIQSQLSKIKPSSTITSAIFMTDQKINVTDAFDTLTEQIKESNEFTQQQKKYLLQSYIRVYANDETAIECLSNGTLANLSELCSFPSELNSLIKGFEAFHHVATPSTSTIFKDEGTKTLENKLAEDGRDIFRQCTNAIKTYIEKNPEVYEENMELFNTLLPASKLHNSAYVIFSTTKKALFGFNTVFKNIRLQDLKGSLLLIDEFDKQNSIIYDTLIEQAKRNKIHLITTIRTIKNAIQSADIQTDEAYNILKKNSKQHLEDMNSLWDMYHMDSNFDLSNKATNAKLFLSRSNISVFDQQGSASIDYKKSKNKNIISFSKDEIEHKHSLTQFVNKCDLLLNYDFPYKILSSAQSFMQVRKKETGQDIPLEVAIKTVLTALNLRGLASHVIDRYANVQKTLKSKQTNLINSYHDTGLKSTQAFSEEDTLEHIDFRHFAITGSATNFLANIIKATKNHQGNGVIGISATASSKTLLHNFDVDYLERTLENQYIELSGKHRKSIQDYYNKYRPYSEKEVNLQVSAIQHSSLYLDSLISKCSDKTIQYYVDDCNLNNNDSFVVEFISKLIHSIELFFQQENNRYMVCFLGRRLGENYKGMVKLVEDAVIYFQKEYKHSASLFPDVNTNFYENKYKKNVLGKLKTTTDKVIVISSYNTLGKGFNGQYEFNQEHENGLIQLRNKKDKSTDIDTLYVEKPMSKFIFSNKDDLFDQQLSILNQLLLLQENGSFSISDTRRLCKQIVSKDKHSISNAVAFIRGRYINETEDYLMSVWADIEQVAGRVARTSVKRKNILLMLDESLIPTLQEDNRDLSLSSHEYRAIIDFAQSIDGKQGNEDRHLKSLINFAKTNTTKGVRAIIEIKNTIFKERPKENNVSSQYLNACECYTQSRDYVLKNPTIVDRKKIPQDFVKLYLFTPTSTSSYCYTHDADDSQHNLESYDFFGSQHKYIMDKSKVHLDKLSKNNLLVKKFEEQGIPLSWKEGNAIISPPVFRSLYKAVLGEKVIEIILQSCKISTTELTQENFELMDFIIGNSSGKTLPLDVKFWEHEDSTLNEGDSMKNTISKTLNKSKQLGYESAVLCGVFAHEDNLIQYFDNQGDKCTLKEASLMSVTGVLSIHDSSILIKTVNAIRSFIDLKGRSGN